jgi:hypothetical protein
MPSEDGLRFCGELMPRHLLSCVPRQDPQSGIKFEAVSPCRRLYLRQRPHLSMSVMLAKKFCERLHRFDVRAENLESGQDRHG